MPSITSKNLLTFIKNSPSAYHSIASIKKILKREGFVQLSEGEPFSLTLGGKYYVIRNMSSIIAFRIGDHLNKLAFNIVASHSDCPGFKVKPNAELNGNHQYVKLDVEGYGGMLCSTFFDRPLSLAGRAMVKKENQIASELINFDRNLLSIPNVAIHMNRKANEGYAYNMAVDMMPTLSLNTNLTLKSLLAKELNTNEENILGYDLYVYNHTEGYFWGAEEEFISSPKLDDLQCAYTTLLGFIKSKNDSNVSVYCCFDNEEVGSVTRQGPDSDFLSSTLQRIARSLQFNEEEYVCGLSQSFFISADNAHAIHPTHPELSDPLNQVYLNKGIVIKYNAAQSYTSDSYSAALFQQICNRVDVPYQIFTNRSDLRGGGTLGNISSSHVSITSVDIGLPQLAMHSCMETAGDKDNVYMVKAITEFYNSCFEFTMNGEIKFIEN